MKLLFDQNISSRIILKLNSLYPFAQQVRNLGLENYSDIDIWKYAKLNGYSIVTFDYDFFDLSNLYGHPPKIIWLRLGNTTTNELAQILSSKINLIKDFIDLPELSHIACLEIK